MDNQQERQEPVPSIDAEAVSGNIFAVLGAARVALRRANASGAHIEKLTNEVMASKSYEEALATVTNYVNIS